MASTTNMNIVLGQGSAIKEIHNPKKQNLEISQQVVAQNIEGKNKQERDKIQTSEKSNKIDIKKDPEKKKGKKDNKRGTIKKKEKEKKKVIEGSVIDITV